MIETRFGKTVLAGLAALAIGASLPACGKADSCPSITTPQHYEVSKGYAISNYKTSIDDNPCPPGCRQTGETKTHYCCWCPD